MPFWVQDQVVTGPNHFVLVPLGLVLGFWSGPGIMSGFPESRFPPAFPAAMNPSPLGRQINLAQVRASEQVRPDDSVSGVGSHASWSRVDEAPQGTAQVGKAPPPHLRRPPVVPEADDDDLPEIPADVKITAPGARSSFPTSSSAGFPQSSFPPPAPAPAMQAARAVSESKAKQSVEDQKARAKTKGKRGVRWGPMQKTAAQHSRNFELPRHIRQVGTGPDERSVLIVDDRDARVQSPYQGWLLDEILVNAQAQINVNSDRQLIRAPNLGYHLNLFYVRSLDGYKLTIVGSMTSYGSVPCGRWDAATARVLSHEAFQPFRWPMMREDSSIWVDVKMKIEGHLLLHLEMRGYRSDSDMTVQLNYMADGLVMQVKDLLFIPAFVVTVFQGYNVVALSFEVGGRIYVCSEGGVVVALDHPLCHFEVRMISISSADAIALDADRLEFRFRSASERLDVACSSITVPATWLVVSRVSGPTLKDNSAWCRRMGSRVEGPDQVMQMSQLAGIHAHWTTATEASSLEEVGPRVSAVDVSSHASNIHLVCEAPLFKSDRVIVPDEAIALQCHDPELERAAAVLPPITGGPPVVPCERLPGALKALTGPRGDPLEAAPVLDAKISLTDAGSTPEVFGQGDRTVWAQRRSLEARQSESISVAAVTPQLFVTQVGQALNDWNQAYPRGGSTSSAPRSFGPEPKVEEAETEEV